MIGAYDKMKRFLLIAILVTATLTLAACARNDEAPNATDQQEESQNQIVFPGEEPELEEIPLVFGHTLTETFQIWDQFEITFGDNISFVTIDSMPEDNDLRGFYNAEIAKIPIAVTNISGSDMHDGLGFGSYRVYGLDGDRQDTLVVFLDELYDNIIVWHNDIAAGATVESYLPIVFTGNGDYWLRFPGPGGMEVRLPISK